MKLLLDASPLRSFWPLIALAIFILAYCLVVCEEVIKLKKSKPVLISAGLIWIIAGFMAKHSHQTDWLIQQFNHAFLEYSHLLLFLLVAITFVNVMNSRKLFEALKAFLIKRGLSYRQLFWLSGVLAFFLSSILDNLTTALILGAVILNIGKENKKFIQLSIINIVVAANAGGVFSPFGDITTLMVWQKGILSFSQFFNLFFPALINFLIPASLMHFAIPNNRPDPLNSHIHLEPGAIAVMVIFLITLLLTVGLHHYLHLPPVLGMMTGLGVLNIFGYYKNKQNLRTPFDSFKELQIIEWDTLLFFYGVMLSVAGLDSLGFLSLLSENLYNSSLLTTNHYFNSLSLANFIIGIISAFIDNIPVMYSILSMHPSMSEGQWLLVTLTTGVGGSLLSVGSAAGVALMGQARNKYTFLSHLSWSWAIFLGYIGSCIFHCWWNKYLF
ncbi:MAG: hypothetical protein JWM09_1147 [Francisellaceae bacterium]|nr:hypothetical protein [Francisellaceae bacterium]